MSAVTLPYVSITAIDATGSEVGRDPGVFRVSRTGPTTAPLRVDFEGGGRLNVNNPGLHGTWFNPVDCDVTNLTLYGTTIPAGASYIDLVVTPRTDVVTEGDEFMEIRARVPDPVWDPETVPTYTADRGYVRVTLSDESGPETFTIEATQPLTSEAGDRPAVLTVRRAGDLTQRATVAVEYSGTAYRLNEQPDDLAAPGILHFDPGETTQNLYLAPFADALVEGTETLTATLVAPNGGITIGSQSTATMTVEDGPVVPVVSLPATADAWVGDGADADVNFGSGSTLQVRDPNLGGARQTYLKFDLTGVDAVASATLKVWYRWAGSGSDNGVLRAAVIPDAVWSEATVTYNSRPVGVQVNGGALYVNRFTNPTGQEATLDLSAAVQHQKLLGATTLTVMLSAITTDPARSLWTTLDGRDSTRPPKLEIESESATTGGVFSVSHRALTVPEGGSGQAFAYFFSESPHLDADVFKVPGGDPDINATTTSLAMPAGSGERSRAIAFTAAPDADAANGSATFVITQGGTSRVIVVRESDTGVGAPPADPSTTVPATSDGFAQKGATTGFGLDDELLVRNAAGANGEEESFLHFDLSAVPAADKIDTASLRLYGGATPATSSTSGSSLRAATTAGVGVYAAAKSEWYWDEGNLVWSNRPTGVGSAVTTATVGATGWYNFDVAPLLRAQKAAGAKMVTIALKGTVAGGATATFASDEAAANRPSLVINGSVVTPPPPPPPTTPTTTVSVRASADAQVRDGTYAGTNYGSGATMEVKRSTAAGFSRESYLKFDLSQAGPATGVRSAKVRLFGKLLAAGGGVNVSLLPIADTAWTEGGVKWSNRPAAGAALAVITVSSTAGGWFELDVTAYVKQLRAAGKTSGAFALRAVTAEGAVVQWTTDEATANRPELKIVKDATATPPSTAKTLRPAADATVRNGSYAGQNYGTAATLEVRTHPASGNTRAAVLKFDLSTVSAVASGKLRLFGKLNAAGTGVGVNVFSSTNTGWTESALNWSTQPVASATPLKTFTVKTTTAAWYEVDMTAFLKAEKAAGRKLVTLVLKASGVTEPAAVFNSDENSANGPQLVVT